MGGVGAVGATGQVGVGGRTIEPGRLDGADEKLGTVGVGASVGHGEDALAGVLELEVLVRELLAVDGLPAGAITVGEVTALQHEVGDDAVEAAALEVEGLARLADTLLAGAEGPEVLDSLGDGLSVQLHLDAAGILAVNVDVEKDGVGDLWLQEPPGRRGAKRGGE